MVVVTVIQDISPLHGAKVIEELACGRVPQFEGAVPGF